jgi:hypothetical protein
MYQITLTTATLLKWAQHFESVSGTLTWPLGVCLLPAATTWLAPPVNVVSKGQEFFTSLQVRPCRTIEELNRLPSTLEASFDPDKVGSFLLGVGIGSAFGHLVACYKRDRRSPTPVSLHLVGAETVPVSSHDMLYPFANSHQSSKNDWRHEIWGPTRAALGEDVWQRYRRQKFAVVGAGRTGTGIAEALHRNGGDIVVFDDDCFSPSNVGESWLANGDDVYMRKVQVVVDRLKESSPNDPGRVAGVAHSILSLASLSKIKESTVLISAVDNPTARLMAALLSVTYMIPLLDIGTGIFHRGTKGSAHREMGADIRWCLPGRCLLCSGGIHDVETGIEELKARSAGQPFKDTKPWFEQRSGSLRSLNTAAIGFALRLIEDWLAHRFSWQENRWLHLEFSEDGSPMIQLERFAHELDPNCPLCALTGLGDAGVKKLSALLDALSRPSLVAE